MQLFVNIPIFDKSPFQGKHLFLAAHSPTLESLRKRAFAQKSQVWRSIMKSFIQAVAVAAVLAVPAVSFAQSNAPLTRAEVRAQLVQFEKAGPADSNTSYPVQALAAESMVAAQNGASTGYGGVANGSSASGARRSVSATDWRSMYGNP
jgi:hypothetical protein